VTPVRHGFDAWEASYRASPRSLSIVRVLFGATLLLLLLPRFQWMNGLPDAFFHPPPGLTSGFTGFPPRAYFIAVDAVLITAAVFLTAGRHVTLASVLISGGLLAGNVWAYSFGKITHDILLVVLPLFLAAAGWDGRSASRARPMALLAVVICLAMATGAWQKIDSGWLTLPASAVLGHTATAAATAGESSAWRLALKWLPSAAWKAMDYVTVGFESAFLVLVIRASAFRVLCGVACFFHVGIALLMRITFVWNIPAYAAYVEWDALLAAVRLSDVVERWERGLAQWGEMPLLAVSAVLCVGYLRWGSPLRLIARGLPPELEGVPRTVAIVLAALIAIVLVALRVTGRRGQVR
jgi:hypothetical protein